MDLRKWFIYSKGFTHNTFIGGLGGSEFTTKAELASFLSISESDIDYFVVTDIDVRANIKVNYDIPTGAFKDNTGITSYRDVGGKVQNIFGLNQNAGAFNGATNLKSVYFPSVTTIRGYSFMNSGLESGYFPEVVELGYSGGDNAWIFRSSKLEKAIFPKLENIYSSSCFYSVELNEIYMPLLKNIFGSSVFQDNVLLTSINLPSLEYLNTGVAHGCSSLISADFPNLKIWKSTYSFNGTALEYFSAPNLEEIEGTINTGSNCFPSTVLNTVLDLRNVHSVTKGFFFTNVKNWVNLTTIRFDSLTSIDEGVYSNFLTYDAPFGITWYFNSVLETIDGGNPHPQLVTLINTKSATIIYV